MLPQGVNRGTEPFRKARLAKGWPSSEDGSYEADRGSNFRTKRMVRLTSSGGTTSAKTAPSARAVTKKAAERVIPRGINRDRSSARALESRPLTVPTGQCKICATSSLVLASR